MTLKIIESSLSPFVVLLAVINSLNSNNIIESYHCAVQPVPVALDLLVVTAQYEENLTGLQS